MVGFGQWTALTPSSIRPATDLAGLHAGAVQTQAFAQAASPALAALAFHVDEVDDDEPQGRAGAVGGRQVLKY